MDDRDGRGWLGSFAGRGRHARLVDARRGRRRRRGARHATAARSWPTPRPATGASARSTRHRRRRPGDRRHCSGAYKNGVTLGVPGAIATDTNTRGLASTAATTGLDGRPGRAAVSTSAPATSRSRAGSRRRADRTERGVIGKRGVPGGGTSTSPTTAVTWASCARSSPTAPRAAGLQPASRRRRQLAPLRRQRRPRHGASASTSTDAVGLRGRLGSGDLDNTGPLTIGKVSGYPKFNGELDDLALYPSLLSPERIQAHYYASRIDTTAPTVTLATPPTGGTVDGHDADLRRHVGRRRSATRPDRDRRRSTRARPRRGRWSQTLETTREARRHLLGRRDPGADLRHVRTPRRRRSPTAPATSAAARRSRSSSSDGTAADPAPVADRRRRRHGLVRQRRRR